MLTLVVPMAALLVVGLVAIVAIRGVPGPAANPDVPAPASPAIEARWGIRVTQVGVTADGGLIDFRYQVLDPDKALAMDSDLRNVPTLIDEQSGTVVSSAALMPHRSELRPGATYFYLYRNTDGAIRRGSAVTVKVGDLTLAHVIAK